MRVLISYHNFVRDYRGSLLLREALRALGHSVWLAPHWHGDTEIARIKDVDVIVGCQIAERSTSYLGTFARDEGIHLVLNSSEQFTAPQSRDAMISFDGDKLNEEVIAFQSIACAELYQHIASHPRLAHKDKYRFLGLPRYDLSVDPDLRGVETAALVARYRLPAGGRRFLYLSSLLFDESFRDVPVEDMQRFKYQDLVDRNKELAAHITPVLKDIVNRLLGPDDVLLIKKHPWDLSDYFERQFDHPQVRMLRDVEYIVPCLDAADFVLHSFSTAAIEAWVMGKPTIAIIPHAHRKSLALSHMQHEVLAETFGEIADLVHNYPSPGPKDAVQQFLAGRCDGMATIRLAREIHGLSAKAVRRPFREGRRWFIEKTAKHFLSSLGYMGQQNLNSRMQQFIRWERERLLIRLRYTPALRRYVERHRAVLHGAAMPVLSTSPLGGQL